VVQQGIRRFGGIAARLLALSLLVLASLGIGTAGLRPAVSAREAADEAFAGEAAAQASALVVQQAAQAVVAAEALAYRVGPGLDAEVIDFLLYGTPGRITDGPVAADGYTWYEFSVEGYGPTPGWVAGEFLAPAAGGFPIGATVVVAGDDLHLRDAPGLSGAALAALPLGTTLTILDGPVAADGYTWYAVEVTDGSGSGWVAGEFLAPWSGSSAFAAGDAAIVAGDGLSLRDAPTLAGAVVAYLALGSPVTITDGPVAADGYTWYAIALNGADADGWVAGEFLTYP
jgi:hypothetical protein